MIEKPLAFIEQSDGNHSHNNLGNEMRKQHNRLGYFTKPFIFFFIDGNRQAHINHCAKYNVKAINDKGISGRPQSVVYTFEKEFKIL